MVPFPDVSKLSAIAGELEKRFPTATVGEIYAMAKPTVESAIAVAASQSRTDGLFPADKAYHSIFSVFCKWSTWRHCFNSQSVVIGPAYSRPQGSPVQAGFRPSISAVESASVVFTATTPSNRFPLGRRHWHTVLRHGILVQHVSCFNSQYLTTDSIFICVYTISRMRTAELI